MSETVKFTRCEIEVEENGTKYGFLIPESGESVLTMKNNTEYVFKFNTEAGGVELPSNIYSSRLRMVDRRRINVEIVDDEEDTGCVVMKSGFQFVDDNQYLDGCTPIISFIVRGYGDESYVYYIRYQVATDEDYNMFRLVDCQLANDGDVSYVFGVEGTGQLFLLKSGDFKIENESEKVAFYPAEWTDGVVFENDNTNLTTVFEDGYDVGFTKSSRYSDECVFQWNSNLELEQNAQSVIVAVTNLTGGEPPVERTLEYWRENGVSYGKLNDTRMWSFVSHSDDVYAIQMYFILSNGKRVSGNPTFLVNADGCRDVSLTISNSQRQKIAAGLLREVAISVNKPASLLLSRVFKGVSVFNGEKSDSFEVLFKSDDVRHVMYPLNEVQKPRHEDTRTTIVGRLNCYYEPYTKTTELYNGVVKYPQLNYALEQVLNTREGEQPYGGDTLVLRLTVTKDSGIEGSLEDYVNDITSFVLYDKSGAEITKFGGFVRDDSVSYEDEDSPRQLILKIAGTRVPEMDREEVYVGIFVNQWETRSSVAKVSYFYEKPVFTNIIADIYDNVEYVGNGFTYYVNMGLSWEYDTRGQSVFLRYSLKKDEAVTIQSGEDSKLNSIFIERVQNGVYTLRLQLMGMSDWKYTRVDERVLRYVPLRDFVIDNGFHPIMSKEAWFTPVLKLHGTAANVAKQQSPFKAVYDFYNCGSIMVGVSPISGQKWKEVKRYRGLGGNIDIELVDVDYSFVRQFIVRQGMKYKVTKRGEELISFGDDGFLYELYTNYDKPFQEYLRDNLSEIECRKTNDKNIYDRTTRDFFRKRWFKVYDEKGVEKDVYRYELVRVLDIDDTYGEEGNEQSLYGYVALEPSVKLKQYALNQTHMQRFLVGTRDDGTPIYQYLLKPEVEARLGENFVALFAYPQVDDAYKYRLFWKFVGVGDSFVYENFQGETKRRRLTGSSGWSQFSCPFEDDMSERQMAVSFTDENGQASFAGWTIHRNNVI